MSQIAFCPGYKKIAENKIMRESFYASLLLWVKKNGKISENIAHLKWGDYT